MGCYKYGLKDSEYRVEENKSSLSPLYNNIEYKYKNKFNIQ